MTLKDIKRTLLLLCAAAAWHCGPLPQDVGSVSLDLRASADIMPFVRSLEVYLLAPAATCESFLEGPTSTALANIDEVRRRGPRCPSGTDLVCEPTCDPGESPRCPRHFAAVPLTGGEERGVDRHLADLFPGEYTFLVVAIDADAQVIARACDGVRIQRDRARRVRLRLRPTT
jgi:hypothetical protein